MDAPPVLTPERIDAMLSIMAEVCLESVVEAGRFQKAAEDAEAFERGGRALQRACRNLRQTIALKQKFDRDEALKAEAGRKLAQAEQAEAERERRRHIDQKRSVLQRHFERVLWDEYEGADREELFDEVAMRVKDAGFEDAFLDTPVEALIERLAHEIGLGAAGAGKGGSEAPTSSSPPSLTTDGASPAKPHRTAEDVEASADDTANPRLGDLAEASAVSAVQSGACSAHRGLPPDTPPCRPEPPPDEGYIPPWDRLRPGRTMPGGSGW